MSATKFLYVTSFVMLPVLYLAAYALRLWARGHEIEWLPKWDALLVLVTVFALERIYTYRYAVSQRSVLTRDLIANLVNRYFTGAVAALIVMPILLYVPEHVLGRKHFLAAPEQLGPFWLQVILIVLSVSFFRYWMHRFQHKNEFLWSLHSYHHRVTDLQVLNTEVSNPIDYALRNVLVFLILGVIGFNPFAILLTVPATNVSAALSHSGADFKGGVLNYVFVTPEVHRWHHTAKVPEGRGYSVNYGVEFAFWDIIFGTYHLPQKDGQVVPPERLGHPGGLPDEPNYLKLLLMPVGLYRPLPWFKRPQVPAE